MTKPYKNKFHRTMLDESWDGVDDGYEYYDHHKRFRRNKIDGVFGGVCAGLGDYLGVDPIIIRILTVISFFVTGFITFWVYLGFWMFTPSDKRAPYRREYRQARKARRRHKANPAEPLRTTATYRDVKGKFRSLETRLQDLEKSITSSEWQLRRDFRDLEG
ncbi:MAG: PspC domain-containing protein [Robiginitomaculum sp.]|nr:PspC domain-containing protein [Robiginitomaculum sp.]